MDIQGYWNAVLRQNADEMRRYFKPDGYVNWHCTNEHFTVDEFIRANCDYPGRWDGSLERVEQLGDLTIMVGRVFAPDAALSFHVVSFIQTEGGKIASIDEYWGDDSPAPQWRQDMHIGAPIR